MKIFAKIPLLPTGNFWSECPRKKTKIKKYIYHQDDPSPGAAKAARTCLVMFMILFLFFVYVDVVVAVIVDVAVVVVVIVYGIRSIAKNACASVCIHVHHRPGSQKPKLPFSFPHSFKNDQQLWRCWSYKYSISFKIKSDHISNCNLFPSFGIDNAERKFNILDLIDVFKFQIT